MKPAVDIARASADAANALAQGREHAMAVADCISEATKVQRPGKGIRYLQAVVDLVVGRLAAGERPNQLSKNLGIPESVVRRWQKRLPRPADYKFPDAVVRRAREQAADGYSLRSVANEFGVSEHALFCWVRGYTRRSAGGPIQKGRRK